MSNNLVRIEQIAGMPANIRRTRKGIIEAVEIAIKLSVKAGEISEIPGGYYDDNGSWVKKPSCIISAQGLQKLNSVAGISIFTPATLIVDGIERNNPYIEREPNGTTIRNVYVRKIGYGRSKTGNPVALDQTLCFSPKNYLVRDLLNIKAERVVDTVLIDEIEKKPGRWYVPLASGLGLEIDIQHKDFKKCLKTFNENVNFAERKAATICERNLIKKFPSIAIYKVNPDSNGETTIPITSWVEKELSHQEIESLGECLARGDRPDFIEGEFEIVREEVEAADDVDDAVLDEDVTPPEPGTVSGPGPSVPAPGPASAPGPGTAKPNEQKPAETKQNDQNGKGPAGDHEKDRIVSLIGKLKLDPAKLNDTIKTVTGKSQSLTACTVAELKTVYNAAIK